MTYVYIVVTPNEESKVFDVYSNVDAAMSAVGHLETQRVPIRAHIVETLVKETYS